MKQLNYFISEKLKLNKDSKSRFYNIDIKDIIDYLNDDLNKMIGIDFAGKLWMQDPLYEKDWKDLTDIKEQSITADMCFSTRPFLSKKQAQYMVSRLQKINGVKYAKFGGPYNGNSTYVVCIIYNYKEDENFLNIYHK